MYVFAFAILSAVILKPLAGPKFSVVGFDLHKPVALYGFFYFLYYVIPCLLLLSGNYLPQRNLLEIAGLVCLGYASFWAGIKLSRLRPPRNAYLSPSGFEKSGLVMLSAAGVVLVAAYHAWRISIGQFYTHAAFYHQASTVFASFMDVFVSQFQLPLILVLGLLARVMSRAPQGRRVRYLLYFYSIATFMVFVVASQFRMAVTALIFLLVARRISGPFLLKVRHLLLITIVSLLALTIIEGFRSIVQSEDIADSRNQLTFAVKRILPILSASLGDWTSDVQDPMIIRAIGQPMFISEVIDATDRGAPYPYGRDILNSMYAVIPRLFWPSKPEVQPLQLTIRERYHLPLHDDSPGPLVEFFAEGGWPGVLLGFLAFGCGLGLLSQHSLSSNGIGPWIILLWVWSTVVQAETELVLGIAATLRNALFVYLMYKILAAGTQWLAPRDLTSTRGVVLPQCHGNPGRSLRVNLLRPS